jgi:hypothetical protein
VRVLLDDTPIPVPRDSLAAAIEAGQGVAGRRGRIIIEVHVDGEPMGDEMLARPPDAPVGAEVRLVSAEPGALVYTTLMEAADMLAGIRQSQRRCADLVVRGELDQALEGLADIVTSWDIVRLAVERGRELIGPGPEESRPGGVGERDSEEAGVRGAAEALAAGLGELKRSLEVRDWSALADVLGSDLDEQADQWRTLVTAIAGRARASA